MTLADELNQFNGNYVNAEMVKTFLSSIDIASALDREIRGPDKCTYQFSGALQPRLLQLLSLL
jgi:hypothetical protein